MEQFLALSLMFLMVILLDFAPFLRRKPTRGAAVCGLFLIAAIIPALLFALGVNIADFIRQWGGMIP